MTTAMDQRAEDLLTEARRISAKAAEHTRKTRAAEDDLRERAEAVLASMDEWRRDAEREAHSSSSSVQIGAARGVLDGSDLRYLSASKASRGTSFLQLMMGSEVNLVQSTQEARLRIKEEYYRFRDVMTITFILFPIAVLAYRRTINPADLEDPGIHSPRALGFILLVFLHEAWLLYFYAALALRENVLASNGSNIRRWWIRHHYFAIALMMVLLTAPHASWHQHFVGSVDLWALTQGIIMVVQNRFQRRKLYKSIALGKAKVLDVVGGESSSHRGTMLWLYPMLFGLQAWQIYSGIMLVVHCLGEGIKGTDWQAYITAVLWLTMAFGNVWTTMVTLLGKLNTADKKFS